MIMMLVLMLVILPTTTNLHQMCYCYYKRQDEKWLRLCTQLTMYTGGIYKRPAPVLA